MNNGRYPLFYIYLIFLSVILSGLFILNMVIGSVSIPPSGVFSALLGGGPESSTWTNIILQFRLPKALTAILVGAGLGTAGLMMQTLFRNPLAGPFVLGISSGASLGVALTLMAGMWFGVLLSQVGITGTWILTVAAIAGSFLLFLLILFISIKIRDSMSLLIIGLMAGSATGALVSVLQYYSKAETIQAYLIWTFGSLGGLTWNELKLFVPLAAGGILGSWLLAKPLNGLLLGDFYAESMGINLKGSRFQIILITSLLTGTITAFCGPIAFIGIAVPHLTRLLFDTSDHRKLIPLVALTGAIVLIVCDMAAQLPGSVYTLPINAVTSILGAPVVIWLVMRKKVLSNSFS